MEPRNRFQGMNSASLCFLAAAGEYDNPIPTRFLAHIDCLKIPALGASVRIWKPMCEMPEDATVWVLSCVTWEEQGYIQWIYRWKQKDFLSSFQHLTTKSQIQILYIPLNMSRVGGSSIKDNGKSFFLPSVYILNVKPRGWKWKSRNGSGAWKRYK